jgi:hypothetical protein
VVVQVFGGATGTSALHHIEESIRNTEEHPQVCLAYQSTLGVAVWCGSFVPVATQQPFFLTLLSTFDLLLGRGRTLLSPLPAPCSALRGGNFITT